MNTTDFTYALQHPQTLNAKQTEDIKSIVNEFPFFQSARAVYLKGLKNTKSFKYNQELKITAAYTTDRSVLFDFITSDAFLQNETAQHINQNTELLKEIEVNAIDDISVSKSVIIDDALRQQIQSTAPILDPELFNIKVQESLLNENVLEVESTDIKKTPEEILEVGKPLAFDKNEVHSFSEWLKITSFKPIIREESKAKTEPSDEDIKTKKFDLIDKFITANPKIEPANKEVPNLDLAKTRMTPPEALMTETLARIYVEQKNYTSAIQSYKILSLKYPEKSGFFADQIKAVKELQEQNNI